MLSVLSSVVTTSQPQQPQQLSSATRVQQFGDHASALEPFSKLIAAASSKSRTVRLQCTVPTWAHEDHALSLDDLHDLRTRALYFIHSLLNKLRAAGIQATYQLAPSSSASVTLRALTGPAASLSRSPSPVISLPTAGARDIAVMAAVDGVPTLSLT